MQQRGTDQKTFSISNNFVYHLRDISARVVERNESQNYGQVFPIYGYDVLNREKSGIPAGGQWYVFNRIRKVTSRASQTFLMTI